MGQTPAKIFKPPTPFGSSPQTNNVSQVQPLQQIAGPGFANASAYDQTQQMPQPTSDPQASFAMQRPFMGRNNLNPFFGMLNQ